MSEIITFPLPNGPNYTIPDVGDENWGQSVTDYLVAIPQGVLPRSGTFTLVGDVFFGASFGLVSQYYKSPTINPATAGTLRLAKTDSIDWRNNANSANLALAINGSDQLTFNGSPLTITTGNLTDTGTDGIVVTGGTAAVVGAGTSLAQHVADTTHNGYLSSTDWNTFNNKQSVITFGNLTDAGTDGITVTGGTGAVKGSGTSIAQTKADATHNGYLSSTDWSTFNSAAGGGITSLTGDVTGTGPGATATTLATVNGNVGSLTNANITVNAKGLITAASNGSSGGSGTVNSGTATHVAYYATSTNAVSSAPDLTVATGQLTFSDAGAVTIQATSTNANSTFLELDTNSGAHIFDIENNASGLVKFTDATNIINFLTYTPGGGGLLTAGTPLAMGSHKITGLAAGTTSGDALSYGQSGATLAGTTLTGSVTISSLTASQIVATDPFGVLTSLSTVPVANGGTASAKGKGLILQTLQATTTSDVTTSSTSYVDITALSKAITANYSGSKIRVSMSLNLACEPTSAGTTGISILLLKDGSSLLDFGQIVRFSTGVAGTDIMLAQIRLDYDDTAADTSAHTYKLQWKVSGGTGELNGSSNTSFIRVEEIGQ